MAKQLPDAFSLFRPSIEAFKQNLVPYGLLVILPSLLLTSDSATETINWSSSSLGVLFGSLLLLIFYPPVIYMYLHAAKGETIDISTAFRKSYAKFWRLVGLSLFVGFLVLVGLIAFIVPGVIFIRRYFLSPYYIMDRNMDIGQAMKTSAAESKSYSGAVYGVLGVVVLIGILGLFGLLGLIASAILSVLYATAPAIRYLQIKQAYKSS